MGRAGGEGWGTTERNQVIGSQQKTTPMLRLLLPEAQGSHLLLARSQVLRKDLYG